MATDKVLRCVFIALGLVIFVILVEYFSSNFQMVTFAMNYTTLYFLPTVDKHSPHPTVSARFGPPNATQEPKEYPYEIEFDFSQVVCDGKLSHPKGSFSIDLIAGASAVNWTAKNYQNLTSPIVEHVTLKVPFEEVDVVSMNFNTEFKDDSGCEIYLESVSITPLYLEDVERKRMRQKLCPVEYPVCTSYAVYLTTCYV